MFKGSEAIVASITALLGAILGIFKYFQYRTRRDKMALVRQAFETVVDSLASDDEVERIAGAILLRRFFDRKTEVGVAGKPYRKEAVNVMAAILRSQPRGNFQKLLADGLAFAPSLERADLQKTNLQFAYLGARKVPPRWHRRWWVFWKKWLLLKNSESSPFETIPTNLSNADFYRADLSSASLKGANASGAQFYQARLQNTVLKGAHLEGASFFEADLRGANFEGAYLLGAKFEGTRNLSAEVAKNLNEKKAYKYREPFASDRKQPEAANIGVFISKPGYLDHRQQQLVTSLRSKLEKEKMIPEVLERPDYPQFGAIAEVQRSMRGCSGAVLFAFRQLEIHDGSWRLDTSEEKQIKGGFWSTPWVQIEAGMAAMLGLPILVFCERGMDGGIFDAAMNDHHIYRIFLDSDWQGTTFSEQFAGWCADVRERVGNEGILSGAQLTQSRVDHEAVGIIGEAGPESTI